MDMIICRSRQKLKSWPFLSFHHFETQNLMKRWTALGITQETEERTAARVYQLFLTSASAYFLVTKRFSKIKVNCSFPNTLIQAAALPYCFLPFSLKTKSILLLNYVHEQSLLHYKVLLTCNLLWNLRIWRFSFTFHTLQIWNKMEHLWGQAISIWVFYTRNTIISGKEMGKKSTHSTVFSFRSLYPLER